MNVKQTLFGLTCALSLSACGGGGVESAGSQYAGPMVGNYGKAQGLIGADARRLIAALGQPRLDIKDRSVRKLQFATSRCIIDAYLYAPSPGREPVTTHVDARLPTGEDMDITACGLSLQ
jgi:hypothetical protein